MATKHETITRVEEGQQAIVITLLAKNEHGDAILDSQLDAAIATAKNVLQLLGCEVAASGSALRFDAEEVGKVARLTATIDVIEEADATEEPTETENDAE